MPTSPFNLAPQPPEDRLHLMDALRGFALLGILLMNIEGMAGAPMASMTGVDPALAGADRWADTLIYLLVQGKFYPLFSVLFGMGFAVMAQRAQAAGRPFVGLYLRRTLLLALFGLLGQTQLNAMNGMKNLVSALLTAIAVVIYAAGGVVQWPQALMMMVAATAGGYGGARVARRIPAPWLRGGIVATGLVMAGLFFWRQ